MNSAFAAARQDYMKSDVSLSELARKHGLKYSALRYRAKAEDWNSEKNAIKNIAEIRQERILDLSDKLLDKVEKSLKEIDRCVMRTKEKTKSVEYDYDLKKPIKELVEEKENVEIIEGMIDKMGLKQLVSTLKDIKDIQCKLDDTSSLDEEIERGVVVLGDIDSSTLEAQDLDFGDDAI